MPWPKKWAKSFRRELLWGSEKANLTLVDSGKPVIKPLDEIEVDFRLTVLKPLRITFTSVKGKPAIFKGLEKIRSFRSTWKEHCMFFPRVDPFLEFDN